MTTAPTPGITGPSSDPADLAFPADGTHPWVDAMLRRRMAAGETIDRAISADDEMLQFAIADAGGDFDAGLCAYFRSGFEVAATLQRIVAERFGDADRVHRMLDFGCGYGRVTRFVAGWLDPSRLWVSDLVTGAVEFQRDRFGVHGFRSASEPSRLEVPSSEGDHSSDPDSADPNSSDLNSFDLNSFDLIYVGSLFTHLPPSTFSAWFERLAGLLAPDGLLVFTVHDQRLMPRALEMPAAGIRFEPSSESRTIDHAEYGSTWVTEEFVRGVVEASSADWQSRRLERGLCGYQDLWLVASAETAPLSELDLPLEPEGQIERCEVPRPGQLELAGWAVARDDSRADGRIDRITVELEIDAAAEGVDDRVITGECTDLAPRVDIAAALDRPDAVLCGWRCGLELPDSMSRRAAYIEVVANTLEGASTTLYAGGLERLLHQATRENYVRHRQRVFELAEIVEDMKRSWFWRQKVRWFRLKRRLGWTDEDPEAPRIRPTDRRRREHGEDEEKKS